MAKITFETALKQLEEIVKEMESGDLPLEQALKKYETGIEKVRYCMEFLDSTEKKITRLTRDLDGSIAEVPFDNE
jgi:exodeoxyribonuclease VII small subunit